MKDRTTIIDRPGTSRPRDAEEPLAPPEGHSRYEVGAEIARGGMGRVVEATDTLLGRTVAVKEALVGSDEAMRRFRREIYITARLEHPSIVPVHDAGTLPDGSPYYVMRKVSGRPLTELIAGAESLEQRLRLLPHVVAAAQAIGHAHHRGVIHRDIKPSNILVGELGETVVIDWGLAKVVGEGDDTTDASPVDAGASLRTRFGVVFGTPGFMAPEQARGENVDQRSDVYALGATLYYTFTRQPPHASASETEMMTAVASGPATPIGSVVTGLPRELATIVDKALAYEEADRYADAVEVAADLQRFVSGQLVASHEYSRRERLARFVRRNKVAVAISTIAVVTLAVGGTFAIRGILDARNRANQQAALATQREHDAELARQREEMRGDQLLLTQAGVLATQNPTAAVAQLKQLTQPPERWQRMWRQARAVAATAEFNGVARAINTDGYSAQLGISPNGERALAVDSENGVVTWYDLSTGAHTRVDTDGRNFGALWADDDRVVTYRGKRVRIANVTTGTHEDHEVSSEVRDVTIAGTAMFWTDVEWAVHRVDMRVWDDNPIATTGRIVAIEPSRDGTKIVLSGYDGSWLYTPAKGTLLKFSRMAYAHMPAWDRDGKYVVLAGYHDTELYRIEEDKPPVLAGRREFPKDIVIDVVVSPKGMVYYTLSSGGFRDRGPTSPVLPITTEQSATNDLSLSMRTFGDTVFIPRGDRIDVYDHYRRYTLVSPSGLITGFKTNAKSLRAVAITNGRMLVWDLATHYPASGEVPEVTAFVMVGKSHAAAMLMFDGWSWLDLVKRHGKHVPGVPMPMQQFSIGAGDSMSIIDPNTGSLMATHDGQLEQYPDKQIALAVALADQRTAFLTETGDLAIRSVDGKQRLDIMHRNAKPEDLDSRDGWLLAAWSDGMFARIDLKTMTIDTFQLYPHSPELRYTISLSAIGDAFVTVGKVMYRYERKSHLLFVHAVLPETISGEINLAEHTICTTGGGNMYSVSHSVPAQVTALPANIRGWFTFTPELALFSNHDGTLSMLDATNGQNWPVATPHVMAPEITSPALSDDSKHFGAIMAGTLYLWENMLPNDASDTARWLEQLTNATAESGTSSLTFHEMLQPRR
ncbi:MAG: serine/threonine-protein kinase [Kofleriaceae bacterium]